MLIALHKNARITPAMRQKIAASSKTGSVQTARYGINGESNNKWKQRHVFIERALYIACKRP